MRYLLLLAALLLAFPTVRAQDDARLVLSRSLLAVKIADPGQRLDEFGPLLNLLDGAIQGAQPAEGEAGGVAGGLTHMVGMLRQIPGVNARGDLWIAVMPVPQDEMAEQALPVPATSTYIILPLANAGAFQMFLAAGGPENAAVCGRHGVFSLGNHTPAFTEVVLDVPFATRHGIAVSIQMANIQTPELTEEMPALAMGIMKPIFSMMEEQQRNVQRAEIGLGMVDDVLSAESFVIPVEGSALARQLAADAPEGTAAAMAAYLPQSLAYCGAGGPLLEGAPGTAHALLRLGFGILGTFVPEQHETLSQSFTRLTAQCGQGRALGITTPPDGGSATLVAAYRTTGATEARAAVHGFVSELAKTRDAVMGGFLTNVIALDLRPGADVVAGVPVDVIHITVTPLDDGDPDTEAPTPVRLEGRVACVENIMFVTLGFDGRLPMAEMLAGVTERRPGYTSGARYQALKATLPEKVRGFESFDLLNICRIAVSWIPEGEQRTGFIDLLRQFPAQRASITTHQDTRPEYLHSEVRIPSEQLEFVIALVNTYFTAQRAEMPAQE